MRRAAVARDEGDGALVATFGRRLPKGTYTVRVFAIDAAGNVGRSGKGRRVRVA